MTHHRCLTPGLLLLERAARILAAHTMGEPDKTGAGLADDVWRQDRYMVPAKHMLVTFAVHAPLFTVSEDGAVHPLPFEASRLRALQAAALTALGVMRSLGWDVAVTQNAASLDDWVERQAAQEAFDALKTALDASIPPTRPMNEGKCRHG